MATARAMAISAGRRVEVLNLRSETGQVFANPSGTLTLEQHNRPVRVRRPAGWVPVDTTLVRRADGSVAPAASSVDVVFSGGGSQPLITMVKAGRRLSLSWPAPLPMPALDGDIATYREVLPGVDLEAGASGEGFSYALVVKTREAAGNPVLRRIAFRVRTAGLQLRSDEAAGVINAVDEAGRVVFASGAPLMWDSADRLATAGGEPEAAQRRELPLPVEVSPGELAVKPNQTMLTSPHTVFPVRIDPPFHDATTLAWTMVNARYPNQSYWAYDRNQGAKVGYSQTDNVTYRSLFRMNTAPVNGKQIISATFRIWEFWSWSCSARWVELWRTGPFDSGTTWNNQPGGADWPNSSNIWQWSQNVAKGYSTSCGAGFVEFNAVNAVREAAGNGWADLTLGLRAYNEADTFGWKKFNPDPVLSIEYNSYPDPPGDPYADIDLPCTIGSDRPWTNTDVTMQVTGRDADSGNVQVQFEWWYTGGSGAVGSNTTAYLASGSRFSTVVPISVLQDGRNYSWRARVYDGSLYGAWGPWCEFSVDKTAPTSIPAVTSTDFPEGDIGIPVGVRGEFTFTSADPEIAGYRYGLSENAPYFVPAGPTPDRRATVPVTMWSTAWRDLYVYSVDRAGNWSIPLDPASYPTYLFRADASTATPPHVLGDVNGDGPADAVAVNQRDADQTVFMTFTSTGTGFYAPSTTWDSGQGTAFRADKIRTVRGDFNGDGRTDIGVVRDEGSGRITIWLFYGDGIGFVAPAAPAWDSGPGNWLWSAARYHAGDFNGDGKADIGGFYDYGGGRVKLWLFYGTATGIASSPPMVWDSGAGNWYWGLSRELVGDFNGDGKADLGVFYDYGSGVTRLWLLYGTATGVTAPSMAWYSGVGNWAWGFSKEVAGDFDNDGKDDIAAFYDYGNGQTKIWLFPGAALAAPALKWDSGPGSWRWGSIKATAGDWNGDGRSDVIAFYEYYNRRTKLWTFDGTATGITAPTMRWDSGENGLTWARTSFH